jgi:hypothetical protein
MKKLLFFFLFLPLLSQGQDSSKTAEPAVIPMPVVEQSSMDSSVNAVNFLEKSVWRVEFFGPGIINESRLGQQTTFVSQLRFIISTASMTYRSGTTSESYFAYNLSPQLSGAIRQYYNFAKRLSKGKSIRYNSGNYVSAKLLHNFGPIIEHTSGGLRASSVQGTIVQALWGFQRTYRKNFYLNLELGLGISSYRSNPLTTASYFTLGYTFPNHH